MSLREGVAALEGSAIEHVYIMCIQGSAHQCQPITWHNIKTNLQAVCKA